MYTGICYEEQIDTNKCSPLYGQKRYIEIACNDTITQPGEIQNPSKCVGASITPNFSEAVSDILCQDDSKWTFVGQLCYVNQWNKKGSICLR